MVMTGSAVDQEAPTQAVAGPSPGQARRTGRGHIDSFGQGRICAVPECITKLSRYNPSTVCSLHDKAVLPTAVWTR